MARMMGLLHDYLGGSYTGNKNVKRYGTHMQRQAEKRELTEEVDKSMADLLLNAHRQCGVCGEEDDPDCGQRC